jgi:hypothetical protein
MPVPSFVFEHPLCQTCAAPMNFLTRGPHPTLVSTWERVTFECAKCGGQHTCLWTPYIELSDAISEAEWGKQEPDPNRSDYPFDSEVRQRIGELISRCASQGTRTPKLS